MTQTKGGPDGDVLAALDLNRLRDGNRRSLDPANQALFDEVWDLRHPTECSPTLTECPRCKNDFRKCDGFSRSQKLKAAGFTRRPSPPGKMAGGLWKDTEDDLPEPSRPAAAPLSSDARSDEPCDHDFVAHLGGGYSCEKCGANAERTNAVGVRSTPAGLTDSEIIAIWCEVQPDGGLEYPDAIRFARAILNTGKS